MAGPFPNMKPPMGAPAMGSAPAQMPAQRPPMPAPAAGGAMQGPPAGQGYNRPDFPGQGHAWGRGIDGGAQNNPAFTAWRAQQGGGGMPSPQPQPMMPQMASQAPMPPTAAQTQGWQRPGFNGQGHAWGRGFDGGAMSNPAFMAWRDQRQQQPQRSPRDMLADVLAGT